MAHDLVQDLPHMMGFRLHRIGAATGIGQCGGGDGFHFVAQLTGQDTRFCQCLGQSQTAAQLEQTVFQTPHGHRICPTAASQSPRQKAVAMEGLFSVHIQNGGQ